LYLICFSLWIFQLALIFISVKALHERLVAECIAKKT
jgi:hypothetical protein